MTDDGGFRARDRTVHATHSGGDVVRYDRAGKWYLEPTDPRLKRQEIGLREAVRLALWGREQGGTIYFKRLGGRQFDAMVRAELRRTDARRE